jgi:hypothetical protein
VEDARIKLNSRFGLTLAPFVADTDTNTVLTNFPLLYLYAALQALYEHLNNGDNAGYYKGLFDEQCSLQNITANSGATDPYYSSPPVVIPGGTTAGGGTASAGGVADPLVVTQAYINTPAPTYGQLQVTNNTTGDNLAAAIHTVTNDATTGASNTKTSYGQIIELICNIVKAGFAPIGGLRVLVTLGSLFYKATGNVYGINNQVTATAATGLIATLTGISSIVQTAVGGIVNQVVGSIAQVLINGGNSSSIIYGSRALLTLNSTGIASQINGHTSSVTNNATTQQAYTYRGIMTTGPGSNCGTTIGVFMQHLQTQPGGATGGEILYFAAGSDSIIENFDNAYVYTISGNIPATVKPGGACFGLALPFDKVAGKAIYNIRANGNAPNYFGGDIEAPNMAIFADNAAALAGGLAVGTFYRTSTGQLMIVF